MDELHSAAPTTIKCKDLLSKMGEGGEVVFTTAAVIPHCTDATRTTVMAQTGNMV